MWRTISPNGDPGPNNAWKKPQGEMILPYALAISQNTTAAQLTNQIGPTTVYNFLTEKLHFQYLNPQEDSVAIGAMSIGGLNGGMTVRKWRLPTRFLATAVSIMSLIPTIM